MESAEVSLKEDARLHGKISFARGSEVPVYTFLGIPYAQPPVGKLRFQRPKRQDTLWHGERDATEFGAICPQKLHIIRKTYYPFLVPETMSEDCLFLNVWTPTLDPKAKLAVMVWIYGGSFIHGFSDYYDGTAYAAHHNVVHVSINYRVGPFGFLSTGDGTAPGNAGLLDQIEALRWVQRYIHQFGGDPNNVTLFGESAGAISINMHMVSPLSRGLFRRAICESGVCAHPSAVWQMSNARKYLYKRLVGFGFQGESSEDMLKYLAEMSWSDIIDKLGDGFNPVLDGYFIPEDPNLLYRKGRVHQIDLLLGFTSHEGAYFIFDLAKSKSIDSIDKARQLIDHVIKKMFFRGHPRGDAICEAVWREYLAGGTLTSASEITQALVQMYGDLLFIAPIIDIANMHSEKYPTFVYQICHRPEMSTLPDWVKMDHGQEIPFVTGEAFLDRLPDVWSEEEKHFTHLLMTFWTNFAKHGNPNGSDVPNWPVYTANNEDYIVLGDSCQISSRYKPERMHFWNQHIRDIVRKNVSKY